MANCDKDFAKMSQLANFQKRASAASALARAAMMVTKALSMSASALTLRTRASAMPDVAANVRCLPEPRYSLHWSSKLVALAAILAQSVLGTGCGSPTALAFAPRAIVTGCGPPATLASVP